MHISIGDKLGPYEILAPLGKGGMGEAYRARDTRMGREVAIKVSAERFSERFEKEVRAIAALNHANICTLYDVGPSYLVMELVEGPTLAERIASGAIPLDETLTIAKQIADALEAAHEKGIVHRDLKPGNVKIKPGGVVKVLDFGLAKMAGTPTAPTEESPTMSLAATQAGVILGTAAYMSPEQARGKPVDKRADIWAFGVVLYEMLTGKRLFEGETVSEILGGVLKEQPDLNRVPAKVRPLLRRCLEKDPAKRLRDIGDAMALLDDAPDAAAAERGGRARPLPWMIAVTLTTVAALVLGFLYFRQPPEETRVLKFPVLPPERSSFATVQIPSQAISPDGRHLAFVADASSQTGLWVRDLDSSTARLLAGTEGAVRPFWSPDSRFIGFFTSGKLKKIELAGGPALTLSDATAAGGASWSKNDIIVFAPVTGGTLLRVAAAGGSATPVTALDPALKDTGHRSPWFLPDGRHFLYTAVTGTAAEETKVYVGDLDSKDRHQVLAAHSNAVYASPGYLLFMREQTLMAQPFDAGTAQTTGDAVPIAEQVIYTSGAGIGQFSSSQNGVLAYASGGIGGGVQLTWFDRSGKALGTVGAPGTLDWAAISPDGGTVAVDRQDPATGRFDLWLHDLARGTASRFTFDGDNGFPIWSPDGTHISYRSRSQGTIYQKAASGTAPAEALDKAEPNSLKRPVDWSRDGRYLIMERNDARTGFDIWAMPLTSAGASGAGDRKPVPYVRTEFREQYGKLSPNGQWLAYVSDETRRNEVYVQTFPNPGGKWQVSTNGGTRPVWSRDGKELFFTSADQKMMAAEVKTGGGDKFEAGVPKALFDVRISRTIGGGTNPWFDVTKDGRFLIPTVVEQPAVTPITVVVNWTAGLKK